MKIVILYAMDEEFQYLQDKFGSEYGVVYEGHNVEMIKTGIGKVNASLTTTKAILEHQPDLVINIGTAGSLNNHLGIGQVIEASSLTYYDVDVTSFGYKKGQMAGELEEYIPSRTYTKLIKGEIVTGDSFVTNKIKGKIREDFPNALVCDMESTAVAQACTKLGVNYLVLRSVSDKADGNSTESFESFLVESGANAAKVALEVMEELK